MKQKIYNYFDNYTTIKFEKFENFDPIVNVKDNFDLLRIKEGHSSRSKSDTYYTDHEHVLRTHTSAHQNELLAQGKSSFLVCGDVYRKDEVDRFHYPVFHQLEGVHLCTDDDPDPNTSLKRTLAGLIEYLFPGKEYRFKDDYFPFTEPSYEIEVLFGEKWLEILGSGVIHTEILEYHGIKQIGWAFGLGLERLCMILYNITDIRLFHTSDQRFYNQFENKTFSDQIEFKPYSKVLPVIKDISFWLLDGVEGTCCDFEWTKKNNFFELVRTIFNDDVESVEFCDKFFHRKHNRYSNTYRLTFSCSDVEFKDQALFSKMCDEQMEHLRQAVLDLNVELR
jgi:phenylalanyl-tRNA synthetase alpha chain